MLGPRELAQIVNLRKCQEFQQHGNKGGGGGERPGLLSLPSSRGHCRTGLIMTTLTGPSESHEDSRAIVELLAACRAAFVEVGCACIERGTARKDWCHVNASRSAIEQESVHLRAIFMHPIT